MVMTVGLGADLDFVGPEANTIWGGSLFKTKNGT